MKLPNTILSCWLVCMFLCNQAFMLSAHAVTKVSVRPHKSNQIHHPKRQMRTPSAHLKASPTDLEIELYRGFPQRLLPKSGAAASPSDNQALAQALNEYASSHQRSVLEDFVAHNPQSRWKPAVELVLASLYVHAGYIVDAVKTFRDVWEQTKEESGPAYALADTAAGQYLIWSSRLGKYDQVAEGIKELTGRVLLGSTAERVAGARMGLTIMSGDPQMTFKCGPSALSNIYFAKTGKHPDEQTLLSCRTTKQGSNLYALHELATKLNMPSTCIRRADLSSEVPIPSVFHWRADHFSAILEKRKDLYHIYDPTFGEDRELWVEKKVLDTQGDGNFLAMRTTLIPGWEALGQDKASKVWGKARGHAVNPMPKTKSAPMLPMCPPPAQTNGMPIVGAFACQSTLNLADTPLSYKSPLGQMDFSLNYNDQEAGQESSPKFANCGTNWTFNWVAYLTVQSGAVWVRVPGGGIEEMRIQDPQTPFPVFAPDFLSLAQLIQTGPTSFERHLMDGTVEIYDQPDSASNPHIFMSQVIDPQGNSVFLNYDENFRITDITDAHNGTTTINYLSDDPIQTFDFFLIKNITDPFNRSCQFDYGPPIEGANTARRLIGIIDAAQNKSSFRWDNASIISMTTPYGTTSFQSVAGDFQQSPSGGVRINFPDGTSCLSIVYPNPIFKTFFWDREALAMYPDDHVKVFNDGQVIEPEPSHALVYHWLVDDKDSGFLQPFLWKLKRPLEGELEYHYAGQLAGDIHLYTHTPRPVAQPLTITRCAGSCPATSLPPPLYTFTYNSNGTLASSMDAMGRKLSYVYRTGSHPSFGLDLAEIRETTGTDNFLLAKYDYSVGETVSHHRPLSYTDASGYTTTFAYNTKYQLISATNAQGKITTLGYDNDFLVSVQSPLPNDITTITYDDAQRLASITDALGYSLRFRYDALDRPTSILYPDDTSSDITYQFLDPVALKDRIGRVTQRLYDSMGQLRAEIDPLGRKTQYEWCNCGSLGKLTDPVGNVTRWHHDIEGRVVSKQFADGTSYTFTYNAVTGNVETRTDARSRITTYSYNPDDSLSGITYSGTDTPNVTVTYDSNFRRISSIANANAIYTFGYNPFRLSTDPATAGAGRLASITNSAIPNSTTSYVYDNLGRTTGRSINGATVSWVYDDIDRVKTETNPLSASPFQFDYLQENKGSQLVSKITYPNGQTANFSYLTSLGDYRLSQIKNLDAASAVVSQFDYQYNPAGEIIQWRQQQAQNDVYQNFEYDKAGQLISDQESANSQPPFSLQRYYAYDSAANRLGCSTVTGSTNTVSQGLFNSTNELSRIVGGGPTRFAATTGKAVSSAVISSAVAVLTSAVANTSYATSVDPPTSTTTVTLNQLDQQGEKAYLAVAGTPQAGTTITLTASNPSLPTPQHNQTVSYTVQSSDALDSIATGITASVMNNFHLKDFGIHASNLTSGNFSYAKQFSADPHLSADNGGSNFSAVSAIDAAGSSQTNAYVIPIQGVPSQSFTYDANGNMIGDGTNTYTWDAENRLLRITYPGSGNTTDFSYDAFDRCVKIAESGTTSGTKQFIWQGSLQAEERDAVGNVGKRFFSLGFQAVPSTDKYYFRDHLGSIRDLQNGGLDAQFSYAPFGERAKIAGTGPEGDFGFAGMYHHERSRLNLTMFRAYDSRLGRWLSRDPMSESAGTNLYTYVGNNPISLIDPLGLRYSEPGDPTEGATAMGGDEFLLLLPVGKILGLGAKALGLDRLLAPLAAKLAPLLAKLSPAGKAAPKSKQPCPPNPFDSSGTPKASDIKAWAESQGWTPKQSANGPLKFFDENGVNRVTLKQGSPRAPGSQGPHAEIRNSAGIRVDTAGNPVTRKSPGNHTPIDYDL